MPLPIVSSVSSERSGPTHLIAVAAGKGGVGKSTVTLNLALALQERGHKVGILDADLYGPSLRRMLPEDRPPSQKGPTLIPAECRGIKVISMAYFHPENHSAAVRAPVANNLITQFLTQVEWGPLDYLLIDFPPGTGDIQLTISQKAPLSGAIMVTTPQQVAVMDVRKAMHLFDQVRVPLIGIVENMSFYVTPNGDKQFLFGQGGGQALAEETGVPLLGQVPIDPAVSLSGDEGKSLFTSPSLAADTFRKLAAALEQQLTQMKADRSLVKVGRQGSQHIEMSWSDGNVQTYRLSDLQQRCPCAGCVEAGHPPTDPEVGCTQVTSVGRYALRIQFTSGCSKGIYTFDMLYDFAESNPRN
ncbi:MAG: P-loop NTPase [Chlamydiales bacterium]|nr:P-loop NTPase [Chlamydiales bacterium]